MEGRIKPPKKKWQEMLLESDSDEESTLLNQEQNVDVRPPLVKHMETMAGVSPGQTISFTDMYNKNRKIGDNPIQAGIAALLVSGAGGFFDKRCPFSSFDPEKVGPKLRHPWHTAMYNADMTINETVWNQLCTYATTASLHGSDRSIITEQQFYKFLAVRRQDEKSWDLFAKAASNAEWSKFWGKLSSQLPDGTHYVKVKDMRNFYEGSSKLVKEAEDRVVHAMGKRW